MILLGWSNYACQEVTKKVFDVDSFKFPMEVIVNIERSIPGNIVVNINESTAALRWFEWLDAPTEIFELIKQWK